MKTKTQNQATVRLFIEEALNKGNLHVLKETIHQDYLYASPTESMQGIDQLEAFVIALQIAFPDLEVSIEDQFSAPDKVCTRVRMTGTHQGDFLGIPATQKSVSLQGVIISEFRDDLIYQEWELLDQLTLLKQLGLVAA